MDDQFAELLADAMTHCWASERGCKKMPVRMIAEESPDGSGITDMVMLCIDHAATYKPEGKVLFDKTLSDENIEVAKLAHW